MESAVYKRQVALLLNILPEVAKESCFALHGGTAINLFVREMPRLSVDIDLTYVPIEDREVSLGNIAKALERIKTKLEKIIPNIQISHKEGIGKLLISVNGVNVKLEVNQVIRGVLGEPVKIALCDKAQAEYGTFCTINSVPMGQLFGGKICAALDRQHPRDIFDVKYLLEKEGFSEQVKTGFLFCLLSSDRPINELLFPNFLDQRKAMENQFTGMSAEIFSYSDYEEIRIRLVKTIHENLTNADKQFLLSIKSLMPDWNIYNFEQYPSIRWKLQNLKNLKDKNPKKHSELYKYLAEKLNINE